MQQQEESWQRRGADLWMHDLVMDFHRIHIDEKTIRICKVLWQQLNFWHMLLGKELLLL